MSIPLAASLAFEAVFLCGNGINVDMKQLRKHNHIEHDASLSRLDAPGNSWSRNAHLIKEMICEFSSSQGLKFEDIAKVRVAREKLLKTKTGRLDWVHNRIALGEASLVIGIWGKGDDLDGFKTKIVPRERIRSFFLHERFPDDWKRPLCPLGFRQCLRMGDELRAIMDTILKQEKCDGRKGRLVKRTITFDGVDFELSHSASIYTTAPSSKKNSSKLVPVEEKEEEEEERGGEVVMSPIQMNGTRNGTLDGLWNPPILPN